MVLEHGHYVEQLVVHGLVQVLQFLECHRVAGTSDDIFTLSVLQVVAIDAAAARSGVAGESHTGTGAEVEVSEHHRHHRDRRPQVIGYPFLAPVNSGTLAVPRPGNGQPR